MKSQKPEKGILVGLLLTLCVVVVGFIIRSDHIAKTAPIEDPYSISIDGQTSKEYLSMIVNLMDVIPPKYQQLDVNMDFDAEPHVYALDHPFEGINCGQTITLKSELRDGTMIIDEYLEGECDRKQNYYLTALLADDREFDTILLKQYINGELIQLYDIDVAEEYEKQLEREAEEAERLAE